MNAPAGELDFFALAAFVAHHAPGAGDPMEMPIDRMIAIATATGAMLIREAGING